MTVFLPGGSKSGKSDLAQKIACSLAAGGPLLYLATMHPADAEDQLRIQRHIRRREGLGFQTVERERNLTDLVPQLPRDATVLLDSVTALFTNELFQPELDWVLDQMAVSRCKEGLLALADRVQHTVFVSDLLFGDAVRYDPDTECFRQGLGALSCMLAARADAVAEVCFGLPAVWKGELPA